MSSPSKIPTPGTLAQIACLMELTARKPGNVHRSADFDDAHFLDFALSAAAVGPALDRSATIGIGASILEAVEATVSVARSNTNLGMILLLAPLSAVPATENLESGVRHILATTSIDDARLAYRAIRLARPGGLGTVPSQDVAIEPEVTLLDAMRLAADRDLIARQYANGFREVFEVLLPALKTAIDRGFGLESAIIAAHLTSMARFPDSLIARKLGAEIAEESSRRARDVLASGWPKTEESRRKLAEFDFWLRADGHARNPGATADLVAAAIFAALRGGLISLPIDSRRWTEEQLP